MTDRVCQRVRYSIHQLSKDQLIAVLEHLTYCSQHGFIDSYTHDDIDFTIEHILTDGTHTHYEGKVNG